MRKGGTGTDAGKAKEKENVEGIEWRRGSRSRFTGKGLEKGGGGGGGTCYELLMSVMTMVYFSYSFVGYEGD